MGIRSWVLLLLCVGIGSGCSLITADVRTELRGQGFHRMLRTELDISSLKRMIDCRVSYYFRIPRGTYIDTDGLKVSLLNHCFLSTPFNTELPANHPSLHDYKPIIFQSNSELRKVFVFSDVLEFPIHFRYHEPSNDESGRSDAILINPPTIYLHCNSNETLMAGDNCRSTVEKLACGCKSRPKCDFFRLNYKNRPETFKVHVPVGRLWQAAFVTYSTIVIVALLVIWTFYSTTTATRRAIDKKDN